jgi:hypothetical protein
MNFEDTPQEAAFRAEAKAWIAANAPKQYEEELRKSSLGRSGLKGADILQVAKAWQKRKADAGSEAAYLRAALSSRRIILLIDNVYDSSFVQHVLPGGPGSLILVTSRRQLALHNAHPINLESLSVTDAVALFVGVCGLNRAKEVRAACHQVIELCGRLPLAVRAAANRLRHRPAL